jgi:hypothetical protein
MDMDVRRPAIVFGIRTATSLKPKGDSLKLN